MDASGTGEVIRIWHQGADPRLIQKKVWVGRHKEGYLGEDSCREGQQGPPKDEDGCQNYAPDPDLLLSIIERFDSFFFGNSSFLQQTQHCDARPC